MPHPKAYAPEQGYKYQILVRNPEYNGKEWEHCDYATDKEDKNHLLKNYISSYGGGFEFKVMLLPAQYWPADKKRVIKA